MKVNYRVEFCFNKKANLEIDEVVALNKALSTRVEDVSIHSSVGGSTVKFKFKEFDDFFISASMKFLIKNNDDFTVYIHFMDKNRKNDLFVDSFQLSGSSINIEKVIKNGELETYMSFTTTERYGRW